MQAICPITLILRSPNVHVKPILHINTEDVDGHQADRRSRQALEIEVLDHLIIGSDRPVCVP